MSLMYSVNEKVTANLFKINEYNSSYKLFLSFLTQFDE